MHFLRLALSAAPRRATLLVFLIAGIAACSGQSCTCITPLKGGFPLAQRHENGIQTRVTQSFLEYVGADAATIVPGLLPGGTTFNVPPQCASGSTQICCGTPQPTCSISVNPRNLTLTPAAPNKIHFDASLLVRTIQNIPFTASVLGVNVHCVISLDTTRTGSPTLDAVGDALFTVDSGTDLTSISLANATITNLDDGDLNLDEAGSDSTCSVVNSSLFKGLAIDYLNTQITSLVSGIVQGELCQTCVDQTDCTAAATACTGGKCIAADGKTCVQLIGIEGKANVGTLLGSVSPQTRASIDILEAAGGYATADTGLSLGLLGGSQSDPHNVCVPTVAAPAPVTVTPSMSFDGDVIPGTTTPYHVGIGVHVSHLTSLLYSFWDSGGLCLGIGSDAIAQLSAKTLEIIMPSMADLIRTPDAPMLLQIRPQNPPTLTLGKGTFKVVNGTKTVDDPLITVVAKAFTADFYLFIDDRYVRVATLQTDLALPLGLDTDASGKIVAIAGDFSKALTNVQVTNTQLLSETPDQLAMVFPTIFSAALAPIFSNLSFALPSFAGLSIMPSTITSTDPDSTGALQYLAIFANVMPANTAVFQRETIGRVVSVQTPPTSEFAVAGREGLVPSVTVAVDGAGPNLEWSYAFDGSAWHPFQAAPTLTLTDPSLWLQGRHVIALRARIPGKPDSLDTTPLELPFFIDSEPPAGTFLVEGTKLVPQVTDRISPPEALRYRVGEGEFTTADSVVIPSGVAAAQLVVQARDEAGNVAVIPYRAVVLAPATVGCSMATGHGSTSSAWIVLFIVGFLLRRRVVLALFVLPISTMAACHHSAAGMGDELAPADSIGRFHDTTLGQDGLQISAYDVTYGDLAYAKVGLDSLASPPTWILVDGDDPTEPAKSTGYRHGRTAPGADVGSYSTIALTANGDPRIAYFDATNHQVKLAIGPFPFSTQAIDKGSADGTVEVGQYAVTSVDLLDVPLVAYMATGLGDAATGFRAEFRVARATSSSPTGASSWNIDVVDTAPISCAGRCASGTACIIEAMVGGLANTDPALSTCVAVDLAACPTACSSSQACIQKVCTAVIATPAEGELPKGVGLFAQFPRNSKGKHALVYYESVHGQLRMATEGDDGKFLTVTLDGMDPTTDMGQFASASFDAGDTLHITYKDAIANNLLYKSVTGGVPSASEIVDSGIRTDGPHPVGASSSVVADATSIAVLYQDQATADLLIAQRGSPWAQSNVDVGDDGAGFSSHLVSNGTRYYTSWIFDRSKTPLGHLALAKVP